MRRGQPLFPGLPGWFAVSTISMPPMDDIEVNRAEARAASVDANYKNAAANYKNSKSLAKDLLKRLGDEEHDLRCNVEAWVEKYCEAQRRATSTRGDAEVRALWFSRSRGQATALIGETVLGFGATHYKATVVWALGDGCKLEAVLTNDRVAVSSYEAGGDDPRDARPDGEDWNEVYLH